MCLWKSLLKFCYYNVPNPLTKQTNSCEAKVLCILFSWTSVTGVSLEMYRACMTSLLATFKTLIAMYLCQQPWALRIISLKSFSSFLVSSWRKIIKVFSLISYTGAAFKYLYKTQWEWRFLPNLGWQKSICFMLP